MSGYNGQHPRHKKTYPFVFVDRTRRGNRNHYGGESLRTRTARSYTRTCCMYGRREDDLGRKYSVFGLCVRVGKEKKQKNARENNNESSAQW